LRILPLGSFYLAFTLPTFLLLFLAAELRDLVRSDPALMVRANFSLAVLNFVRLMRTASSRQPSLEPLAGCATAH